MHLNTGFSYGEQGNRVPRLEGMRAGGVLAAGAARGQLDPPMQNRHEAVWEGGQNYTHPFSIALVLGVLNLHPLLLFML